MTVDWMLATLACGALLALAAAAAEPVAAWFRLPRRWIWAAAMTGAVLLPLAAVTVPGVLPRIRVPAVAPLARPPAPVAALPARVLEELPLPVFTPPSPFSPPLPAVVLIGWVMASLATLGTLAWARRRVWRSCGACRVQRVAGTWVVVSEGAGPMVLRVFKPFIVLPRWVLEHPDTSRMIVRHEREHVAAGDPWLLAIGTLTVVLVPWSPALWWMHRRLRLAVETDCDARVLVAGESPRGYAHALLQTAGRPVFAAGLGWGGRRSLLERRLRAISAPRPRLRAVRALPLAVLACAGAASACHVAANFAPDAGWEGADQTFRDAFVRTPDPSDTTIVIEKLPGGELRATYAVLDHGAKSTVVVPEGGRPIFYLIGLGYGFPPSADSSHIMVYDVEPGSPAASAGVRVRDRIVRVNGEDVRGRSAFTANDEVRIEFQRGNAESTRAVTFSGSLMQTLAERHLRAKAACGREMHRTWPSGSPGQYPICRVKPWVPDRPSWRD